MPEPLTRELVATLLSELHVAFPRNVGMQNPAMMADVYRNGLRGITGDALRAAVRRSIEEDQYFPKVARLRDLANEWQRRNLVPAIPQRVDPDECAVCGVRAERVTIERWKRYGPERRYALVLDEDGKPIKETVASTRTYIRHDARRHAVFNQVDEIPA